MEGLLQQQKGRTKRIIVVKKKGFKKRGCLSTASDLLTLQFGILLDDNFFFKQDLFGFIYYRNKIHSFSSSAF